MSKILVSGLINVETTLRVDAFPLTYAPVRYPFFGVRSTVSGVGYNVARALTTLGNDIAFLSLIGTDLFGRVVRLALEENGISGDHVLAAMPQTAQSVIIYNPAGKRQIHTDLKDIQDRSYPPDAADAALAGVDLAVLCNINFSRPLLARAQAAGVPVATDVHAISSLDDDYNRDFMATADILFMSDESLPCSPEEWVAQVQQRFGTPIVVVGLGSAGALLAVHADGFVGRVPAVTTRPVVNTIGAGDALFSAFVHTYAATRDPYAALRTAVVFASYKIGGTGGADGFLTAAELGAWMARVNQTPD